MLLTLAGMRAAVAAETPRPGFPFDPQPSLPGVPSGASAELLAVRINGIDQDGSVVAYRLVGGWLAVPVQSLVDWHITPPNGPRLRFENADYVRLDTIDGLRWHVDPKDQILVIDVGASAFRRNGVEVAKQVKALKLPPVNGGYVNYDFSAQVDAPPSPEKRTSAVAAVFDAGGSTAYGGGRTSIVTRAGTAGSGVTRLDSTWTVDQPDDLSSVQLGDTLGATGQWGRAVRFGGVRWSTDFSTRPGFVAFPLPGVKGEATVPSIVDLYVNNTHQLQGTVQPGPFDLPDVPVVTGQGQIKMVVHDLLGREQVIVQPYYVTPSLLKPGLHDFSFEAGAVRDNYGIDSFSYGRMLAVATDRAGVTSTFTREFRVEVLREQQTAGAGGILLVDNAATANASVAVSHSGSGGGSLFTGGVDRQSDAWSVSMQGHFATRNFAQVGQSYNGAPPQRISFNASAATGVGSGGIGINALVQTDWAGGSFRTYSFNYGHKVGWLGYASVYASKTTGDSRGYSVGLFFTQSFGADSNATESMFRSHDHTDDSVNPDSRSNQSTLQLQSSTPSGPGFGYRALLEGGDSQRVLGEGFWQTDTALMNLGLARQGRDTSLRVGASGGVAVMPEGMFFARRIDGSFAVVEVGDYSGVRVTRDNQVVARTDANGHAFVGGLRGYENNRIGIEAADLPLDAQVDSLDVIVAPAARAGVSIAFPVQHIRSATLRIVDAAGKPVPPGSVVHAKGQKRDFPVGFDGRLFLTGLPDHGTYVAEWPDASCQFDVEWKPVQDDVPDLGVVVCR